MKKKYSIRTQLILIISALFLLQGLTLSCLFLIREKDFLTATVEKAVEKQISLAISKIELMRQNSQSRYLIDTIFSLEHVDQVVLFDSSCNVIAKQPLNISSDWNCKKQTSTDGLIFFIIDSIYSNSPGMPSKILYKLSPKNFLNHSKRTFWDLFTIFLVTILALLTLFVSIGRIILKPISLLKKSIESNEDSDIDSLQKLNSPIELKVIRNSLIRKEKRIRNQKKLIKEKAASDGKLGAIGMILHDIESPLDALNTIIQKSSFSEQDIRGIRVSVRLLNCLETALQGNLDESSRKERLDINRIVRDIKSMKRAEFSKNNISIELDLYPEKFNPNIKVDGQKLRRILSNLVNNSAIACKDLESPSIVIKTGFESGLPTLSIKDNGAGIPEKYIEQVFEKGFSLSPKNGKGLGLFDAKETIKSWGGSIQIESTLSKGTFVKILM